MAVEDVPAILRGLIPADTPRFVPSPQSGVGRVCACYDGDTVTLLCLLAGAPARVTLRIVGTDAPERRGRGQTERRVAEAVRDVVEALVLDQVLPVRVSGVDKYGRLLGDLDLPDGSSLSEYLLHRGLARAYGGESRRPFSEMELTAISAAAETALSSLRAGRGR